MASPRHNLMVAEPVIEKTGARLANVSEDCLSGLDERLRDDIIIINV